MDALPPPLAFFLLLLSGWVNRQQQAVIDYLLEENVLRWTTLAMHDGRMMKAIIQHLQRMPDTFTDEAGTWEVVGHPTSPRAGKSVVAKVQRPGDPGTLREQCWPAYECARRRTTAE